MSSLKKKTAKAFAWDIGGTIGGQGSAFIISIFLARLLEPAEFGLIGMSMVFISISQVFIDVGFASALIQNKENTNLTYSSVFYVNLFAGILLTATFYFIAPFVGAFYEDQQITGLVRWLSLIFLFTSLNQVQTSILRRKLNFKVLTVRSLIASFIGGVLGVVFAFKGYGVYALVIQQLSSAFLGTVLLWTTSGWRPDFKFSMLEVKKLTGFSAFVFFDSLVSTVFQRLDILLIGKVFSPATLGFYSRAVTLKDQVTRYSSSSLTKVFYPVLSGLQDDDKEYNRIYFKVISVIAFVSYGLTGLLYIMGSDIIIGLFGTKWGPSVIIFQVLVIAVCNRPINSMMVNAFLSKGKSKENFAIGLFKKCFQLIPLVIAYFYGIFEFTVAFVIVSYFLTILNVFFLNRYTKLSVRFHFKKMFEGILPLAIVIFAFHYFEWTTLLHRILLAFGFVVSYLIYNFLIKSEGLFFIYANSSKIFNKLNRFK